MNLSDKIKVQHQAASIKRKELIAILDECLGGPATLTTREATAIKDAADMLTADEQEIQGWREDQRENLNNQVKLQKIINDLTKG